MSTDAASEGQLGRLLRSCFHDVGVDGGGLSVITSAGVPEPLYASDPVASQVERLQFTLGEGPCVDAAASGTPVLVNDLGNPKDSVTARWPVFVDEATRAGVRAIFAFPVQIGAISLGAIDLYRRTPGSLTAPQLRGALSTVDALGLAVLDMPNNHPVDGDADPTSMVVHQAAGMAMVQLDCSIEEALVRLRATAFAEGVAITQLAADLVHGRRRLEKEER